MWRIIMTTSLVYIMMAETRPLEPLEGPLWPNTISSSELFLRNNPGFLNQRNFQEETAYNSDGDYDLPMPPELTSEKRALTMFSRWGPLSNIGKQRTPIRSNFINPEANINTQTRGRIQGQPLRWG